MRSLTKRDDALLSGFGAALSAGRFKLADEASELEIGRSQRSEQAPADLPVRLPPLYERLILSYHWPELDLGLFRLLANPAGSDLSGLLAEMQRDPVFWAELKAHGWFQIGKGPGSCYDPVCFDLRKHSGSGDYRVVRLDHEALLCRSRIREVAELAPSFSELLRRLV